ncbi:MAG: hypothetical protein ACLUHE_03545 [Christensenellales bacterium]
MCAATTRSSRRCKGLEPDVRVLADAAKLTAALMSALEKAEIIRAENPSTTHEGHQETTIELANLAQGAREATARR